MPRTKSTKTRPAGKSPFALLPSKDAAREAEAFVHVIREGVICDTERRGFATPRNRDLAKIVVDASEGFVPLWEEGTTLRWRFQEASMKKFKDPAAAKDAIEELLGEALLKWGDAAPVRFTKRDDAWDFQIVMREADECGINGCVLASAFFPDPGRHKLVLYPMFFTQSREEQVETLIHEIGHIFGLRHFFAEVDESKWPSQVFGEHTSFTIMNYGERSVLTDADRADLKRLYEGSWSGALKDVNGTPIRLVKPFHTVGNVPGKKIALGQTQTVFQS